MSKLSKRASTAGRSTTSTSRKAAKSNASRSLEAYLMSREILRRIRRTAPLFDAVEGPVAAAEAPRRLH